MAMKLNAKVAKRLWSQEFDGRIGKSMIEKIELLQVMQAKHASVAPRSVAQPPRSVDAIGPR